MVKKISLIHKQTNYLVCVNSEEYSEAALHFTCYLAKKNNGSVILLHVIEPSDYLSIGMVADKIRQEKHEESQKLLNELAGKAKDKSGLMPMVIVREGLIEDEIIAAVEEDPTIRMLIVGVSGKNSKKSKTTQLLVSTIGSKINIPMLVVPGTFTIQQMEEVA